MPSAMVSVEPVAGAVIETLLNDAARKAPSVLIAPVPERYRLAEVSVPNCKPLAADVGVLLPMLRSAPTGEVVPTPRRPVASSYADALPKMILPLVAFDVDESVKLSPLAVPPITDWPPAFPVERSTLNVLPGLNVSPVPAAYVLLRNDTH